MTCTKCDFWLPKQSSAALLLEGKQHRSGSCRRFHLDAEQAAIEEGVAAYDRLLAKLADLPTSSGQTPRQISHRLATPECFSPG
jgi:hypothetical protein